MWGGFGPNVATLAIQFPLAEAVVPFVIETARSFRMSVFDWQTKLIHRADGLADLELSSEGVTQLKRPS